MPAQSKRKNASTASQCTSAILQETGGSPPGIGPWR